MGKKKVDINGTPLENITIGQRKEHKHTLLVTILIVGFFGAIIYFLPNIEKLYESFMKGGTAAPSTAVSTNNTVNNEKVKEVTKYSFSNTKSFSFNDMKFSDIALSGNTLTFNIQNSNEYDINLSNKSIFLNVYNSKDVIIDVIYLTGVIKSQNMKKYSFDINEGATSFEIIDYSKEKYPDVSLTENKLTCSKNSEIITYTFKDNKLTTVSYSNKVDDTNKVSYEQMVNKYLSTEGVNASINENGEYIFEVDYTKYTDALEGYYYFTKDALSSEINYKMKGTNYTCK